jgi:uncharacterized membrane protein
MERSTLTDKLVAGIAMLVIALFFLFPPVTVFDKTHAIGYAICHQLPDRTIHFGDTPLPLCARCTGIYLGVLTGLGAVVLRRRFYAVELPPTGILVLLLTFILMMIFDGLNSYLEFSEWLPQIYPTQNWLRLITGTFHGIAITVITYPIFCFTIWQPARREQVAVIQNVRELLPVLAAGLGVVMLVLWQNPVLLYPITVLSTLGVVAIVGMISTILVIVVSRREADASRWSDLFVPVLIGLAITFLLIGGIDWIRATISQAAGLG